MKNNYFLEAKNLSFKYEKDGENTLKDIDLTFNQSSSVLLMGPSGCGKSSLAYCLSGLYPEFAGYMDGEILLDAKDIKEYNATLRSQKISILFQNPDNQFCMDTPSNEILFALENINYQGNYHQRVDDLLSMVGLQDVKNQPIHTLSGGMKQKIALATSLATEAKFMILDEPLANLDPKSRIMVINVLKNLRKKGIGFLIVDHNPNFWISMTDSLILMNENGRIVKNNINVKDINKQKETFNHLGIFYDNKFYSKYIPNNINPKAKELLHISNVSIEFDKKIILNDVNLSIKQGECHVLLGENGAGKTSLLLAIAKLIKYKGKINHFEKVGLIFQNPRFQFLTTKVIDEIKLSLENNKLNKYDTKNYAEEILEKFDLLDYKNASPYELSQGQQRRFAILSMLSCNRGLLLLDEPTYAQDEKSTRNILNLLNQKSREGLATIISTHDLDLAQSLANFVYVVSNGEVKQISKEEFLKIKENQKSLMESVVNEK
ncbi:ABC transporter ATP-binding protein [Helcococcus kunzii]|uniref:ABC transporter ATP-binding protein n=1 Tax=Helcococcus kunzii TaxID=40091 RepID=UPI0021A80ECA|nr:ABC transporter ATP-binding protein [Helcococcus kunzii]MCT1796936.1 ATP-binding cassette domain-containing protein [Helcococcus kunzii]MCT1988506.1 ATP-binding cassette domain-containing protein [Helcococcus kunzii]